MVFGNPVKARLPPWQGQGAADTTSVTGRRDRVLLSIPDDGLHVAIARSISLQAVPAGLETRPRRCVEGRRLMDHLVRQVLVVVAGLVDR